METIQDQRGSPQSIEDDLIALLRREPFWGHVVLALKRRETRDIPTAGVGLEGGLTLYYNPEFYFSRPVTERHAILVHEAMHVANRHFTRERDIREGKSLFNAVSNEAQSTLNLMHNECFHELLNIAEDISINQYIRNIPDDCLSPEKYSFPRDLSMEEYTVLLLEKVNEAQKEGASGKDKSEDGQGGGPGQDGPGQGKPGKDLRSDSGGKGSTGNDSMPVSGPCKSSEAGAEDQTGSGSGKPGDGKDGHGDGETGDNQCPVCNGKLRKGRMLGDHSGWDSGNSDLSQAEIEEANALAVSIVKDCNDRGLIPANMLSKFDDILKPRVNWKYVLRSFPASCRAEDVRRTWMRPNRRLPGLLKGKTREEKLELIVITDSSGSISDQMLCQFSGEISGMAKEGASITVIECDAKVQRVYQFEDRIESFQGRGGTAFTPAFEYIVQNRLKPDGVIYLTDGYGDDPPPFKLAPMLWVVTHNGKRPVSWGKVLFLPEK